MNFLLDFLRAGDLFIDVGANAGVYTMLAAALADVAVIALEPSEVAWLRLIENIELNGYEGVVTAVRAAASTAPKELLLTRGQDTVNRIVALGKFAGETERVKGVPIDDVVTAY